MRLKDISILTPQCPTENIDGSVSFVPMESLRNASIDYKEIPFSEAKGKYTYFGDDDLLIAKVTPCFENGNIAIARNMLHGIGFGSSEIFVLRMNEGVMNTYMFYVTQASDFKDKACSTMCGVGGLKRISPLFMRTYSINIPSTLEQKQIASYLDIKTAAIDKRIAVLEKKQEVYSRLRKSIINRAVTRGLTPDVPLKDSGVDWIGMIPEHWEVWRIKDVASEIFMGKTPIYDLDKDDENLIFGQKNNQQNGIDFDGIKCGTDDFFNSRSEYEFLRYGDVLLNTLGGGSVGRSGYFDYKGNKRVITDGHVMVIRSQTFNTRLLYYFLQSKKTELENMAIGSTNQAFFNVSDIRELYISIPPLPEQRAIADYLDEKCAKIDAAVENISKQIDALKRLKRALINEVVTGKRKV